MRDLVLHWLVPTLDPLLELLVVGLRRHVSGVSVSGRKELIQEAAPTLLYLGG